MKCSNLAGICQRTPECNRARQRAGIARRKAEAGAELARQERETARERRRAAALRGAETARLGKLARSGEEWVPVAMLEAELARRLSKPCPVCGKPVGGNTGRCWRSPRCIDFNLKAYRPGFNLGRDVYSAGELADTG